MNLEKFTQKSLEALQLAQSLAAEHNNTQIEECHLLYAVIAQDGGIGAEIFRKMGVDVKAFNPVKELSKFMIIMAMAAIGLNSNVVQLIKTGGKPLLVGGSCWVGITGVSLAMQHIMGIW